VNCSHILSLSACPTNKSHKDLNQVTVEAARFPKTSFNGSIPFFAVCTIAFFVANPVTNHQSVSLKQKPPYINESKEVN
jgi:hypothetical protein